MTTLQTVDRALLVLFHLAEVDDTGPAEVARKLRVSKGTAFNLLRTLEMHDLAVSDPITQRYRLGPAIFRLLRGKSPYIHLVAAARPVMEKLRDSVNETVTLHVRSGVERISIERFESTNLLRRSAEIGEHWPLNSGATGWVLLAWEKSERVEQFLAQEAFPRVLDKTLTEANDLRAALSRTREQGYAITAEDPVPGVQAISVPVRDHTGAAVAALTISGPIQRWSTERIHHFLPDILRGSEAISIALGFGIVVASSTRNGAGKTGHRSAGSGRK